MNTFVLLLVNSLFSVKNIKIIAFFQFGAQTKTKNKLENSLKTFAFIYKI